MSTTTVYHPTIPDVSYEVSNPAAWVKQGWLKSEPKNEAISEARKATAKATRANARAFSSAEQVTPGTKELPTVDPDVHGNAPETPAEG